MAILTGTEMRYRPLDNYANMQNPPDFSWPWEENAVSYDLVICRDLQMQEVAYQKLDNPVNYYNFPHTFEPGVYYWHARWKKAGEIGPWSDTRRFLLRADARPFTVPDVDTLLSRIPAAHPRIYVEGGDLEGFRKKVLEAKNGYFQMIERSVRYFMTQPFPKESEADMQAVFEKSPYAPFAAAADATKRACNMAMYAAFYYLITGDAEVGAYGVRCLTELATWDPAGPTSYAVNDQAHRRIATYATLAYDWLYPLMTEQQRQSVREMIVGRIQIICESDHFSIKDADKSPFDSHGGTAIGYVVLVGLALFGETEAAERWLRYALPIYISNMPQFGYEDGGWAQGTYYWSCGIFGLKVVEALRAAGIIDLYEKSGKHNEALYAIYCCLEGSVCDFGDNSYIPATEKMSSLISVLAHRIPSPEIRFTRDQIGYLTAYGHTDDSDPAVCIHDKYYGPEEGYIRKEMPCEHYFPDIGWVAMHSDLEDPKRISVFFKSSWYGSFNHSHPDQNSFTIHAYGQQLAIDSGYYDLYNYPFDRDYTRKTYAHNAITYGNGKGQPAFDILAKGKITDYLSHSRLALAGGDATESYKGALSAAKRWLLYVKPDVVVTVDDLAAGVGEKTTFEYWLNSQKWTGIAPDGLGGWISNGEARLDARIHWPRKMTANLSQDFAGPEGVALYPVYEGHARWPIQKRIWFQTEETEATRIVTTLDIHRTGTDTRSFPAEYREDCILLQLDDMTLAVNHKGLSGPISAGNFSFCGTAALVGQELAVLVDGTELTVDGQLLIASEAPVSVACGGGELSISTVGQDNQVKVYLPKAAEIRNRDGVEITGSTDCYGCTLENLGDNKRFRLYNGAYQFTY